MASPKAMDRLKQISSQVNAAKAKSPAEADIPSDEACQKALSTFLQPPRYRGNTQQTKILDKSERCNVDVGGITLQKYIWNSHCTTSIFLTHGFGTSTAFLSPLISHLLASLPGHRIVAVDQAGHGVSEGKEASLSHFIEVISTVVREERSQGRNVACLIGHSVGATALLMYLSQKGSQDNSHHTRPLLVAINPPLESTTLMRGYCAQNGLPLSLVEGMRRLFVPKPEDFLTENMIQPKWASKQRILMIQEKKDPIAKLAMTEQAVTLLKASGADLELKLTEGLGHFKPIGDPDVLSSIESFIK